MIRKYLVFLLTGLIFLLFLAQLGPSATITAQPRVAWRQPVNLSNSPTNSTHPAVVSDGYGHVHVFWSEDMGGPELGADALGNPGNAIFHRCWDGQRWSPPVDVLAVAGDPLADFVSVAIDDDNQLHLVWTGLSDLYYSTVPAVEADSVHAWAQPEIIGASARTRFESDIAVDSLGTVHIVYASKGETTGVYHIMQQKGNRAWSIPQRISAPLTEHEEGFRDVRMTIDQHDRIHVAWGTFNARGFGQGLYYARSEPGGAAWDNAILMDEAASDKDFIGFPSLLAHAPDELFLLHVGAEPRGRVEHTSTNGGATWSEPHQVLINMEGVNGFLAPLVDGADNMHLLIDMRTTADQMVGIYYAPRSGQDWSPIIPIAVEAPYGPTAHYMNAAVRLGNEIHVVWTQLRGGEIWTVRGEIAGIPSAKAQPTPTPEPQSALLPTPTADRERPSTSISPSPASTENDHLLPPALRSPPPPAMSLWQIIGIAAAPVLLFLGVVILWQVRRR